MNVDNLGPVCDMAHEDSAVVKDTGNSPGVPGFESRAWCYFIHWTRSDDEDDYEVTDEQINKLLILTQTTQAGQQTSSRYVKHEGYDRTGDWTTRVKMSQELEKTINDGLYYYEQDLWSNQTEWVCILFSHVIHWQSVVFYFLKLDWRCISTFVQHVENYGKFKICFTTLRTLYFKPVNYLKIWPLPSSVLFFAFFVFF